MIQVSANQAVAEFDMLLSEAAKGQEVVIISSEGAAFKLLALPRSPKPVFGSARGMVSIGADFDDPIEGMEEYLQ